MSQKNVDLLRSGYERFNAGEREPPEDLWHADAEYVPDRNDPDPARTRVCPRSRRSTRVGPSPTPTCVSSRSTSGPVSTAYSCGLASPGTGQAVAWQSARSEPRSGRSRTQRSGVARSSSTGTGPSQPWDCRSSPLATTPNPMSTTSGSGRLPGLSARRFTSTGFGLRPFTSRPLARMRLGWPCPPATAGKEAKWTNHDGLRER